MNSQSTSTVSMLLMRDSDWEFKSVCVCERVRESERESVCERECVCM